MDKSVIKDPITLKLKEILTNHSSGELILKGKTFKKTIYFENGDVVYARSNVIQERLGEILFKTGKLTKSEFWNIHKLMENQKEKIGKILVDKGILTKKDLFFSIQIQIKIIAKSLFYINSGEWDFVEKDLDLSDDSKFHLDLSEIIIDGTDMIKNTFFYKDIYIEHEPLVKQYNKDIDDLLSEEQKKLIGYIKNTVSLSCNDICLKYSYNEETFWKNIIILFLLDIITFEEIKEKKEKNENIEKIIEFFDKLKSGNIDYYSLLSLKINASPEQIKEKYFLLAKKFHPDRVGKTIDPSIRDKANFVFAEINRAYDILENPEKRKEYDIKKFKNNDDSEIYNKNLKEKASILYRKARTLYNRRMYWEATALLEEAIKSVKDKGSYYMLLGLAQMNIDSMKWSAEKNLTKAAELEPMNAEPYVALGKLFLMENMENRSKAFFQKAISIDPDNKAAIKSIKTLKKNSTGSEKKGFFSKKNKY